MGWTFYNSSGQKLSTTADVAKMVQVVNDMDGAVATGTTTLPTTPTDDSVPQNTEGEQYMSLAITPTNASNNLFIQVVANYNTSHAGAHYETMALFQDSTAGALAVGFRSAVAGHRSQMMLNYYMAAGTTSATTFKVRLGTDSAGTLTFNGSGGARLFGGVVASSITITEISA